MAKRLVKSADRKLFGVAGGVAEYFNVDPTLVRVGFVVLCFGFAGTGLVAYVALAILMPAPDTALAVTTTGQDPSGQQPSNPTDGPGINRRRNLFAWSLIGLGVILVAAKFSAFSWTSCGLLAAVLIGTGLVLLSQRSRVS